MRLYPQATSSGEELRLGGRLQVWTTFSSMPSNFGGKKRTRRLCSGLWTETDDTGNKPPLEASALWVGGRKIVLLELLNGVYEKSNPSSKKRKNIASSITIWNRALHKLLDHLHVGVFRATPSGELLEANPAFTTSSRRARRKACKRSGSTAEPALQRREVKMARADGEALWVSLTTTQGLTPSGELVIDGLVEDITERKRARKKRAKKKLR